MRIPLTVAALVTLLLLLGGTNASADEAKTLVLPRLARSPPSSSQNHRGRAEGGRRAADESQAAGELLGV
jgi:hypothetical protein